MTGRLIVLYGPPASGKSTIARILAHRRGSVLFTNTATKAFVSDIFPAESSQRVRAIDSIRHIVIDALIAEAVEVIFTFVYSGSAGDQTFLSTLEDRLRAKPADVRFVRLVCAPETLLERVENLSRKVKGKLSNRSILNEHLSRVDYYARYPSPRTIVINTDNHDADAAARRIDSALPSRA
jgi:shikimate kinase